MKKVIAVLAVLVVLVGAAFATTNDKITLNSKVGQVKPGFVIFSGSAEGTQAGATFQTNKDISEQDIELTFNLKQSGNADSKDYSKYKGGITLKVTINPFKNTGLNATQSTTYQITSATKGAAIEGKLELADPAIETTDKHYVEFGLTYKGKKIKDEDATNMGSLTAKWVHDDTLPMEGTGTVYTSDVVLTYTVE